MNNFFCVCLLIFIALASGGLGATVQFALTGWPQSGARVWARILSYALCALLCVLGAACVAGYGRYDFLQLFKTVERGLVVCGAGFAGGFGAALAVALLVWIGRGARAVFARGGDHEKA